MTQTGEKSAEFARLREILQFLQRSEFHRIVETSRSARDIYAAVDGRDEEGNYYGPGLDSSGRPMHVTAKYDDSQSIAGATPAFVPEYHVEAADTEAIAAKDSADTARDPRVVAQARVEALRKWMTHDPQESALFIAEELSKPQLAEDWRDALVFAAEDAYFQGRQLQERVSRSLRRIALELRCSARPEIEQVVWSALRRYASLVDEDSVNELRDFLDPVGYVDTRLLAFQGVVRLFERHPPENSDTVAPLADRALDIATKLLDPDVFRSGETSAIATQAVVVLFVLGDGRALECIGRAKSLGRRWIARKLQGRLAEVRTAWLEQDGSAPDHAGFALIEQVLSDLN